MRAWSSVQRNEYKNNDSLPEISFQYRTGDQHFSLTWRGLKPVMAAGIQMASMLQLGPNLKTIINKEPQVVPKDGLPVLQALIT